MVGPDLDAFDDIRRGGFGTPEGGFTLRWLNHDMSRRTLGYDDCHPSNRESVAADLARAQARTGPTVFDWLIEIIRIHGPGGDEAEDGVELVLL